MRSARPKVLHEVAGKPLLQWVVDTAREAGCRRCLVVVGHRAGKVRERFSGSDIVWVEQTEQLGTGHALAQVRDHVGDADQLLVLSGDVPGVRAETLRRLLEIARGGWGALAVAEMDQPGSLGRVVTGQDGSVEKMVEAHDATPAEKALTTVNAGIYALPAPGIFDYLGRLRPNNVKGELYLTDALVAAAADHDLGTLMLDDWQEGLGVNTRRDLARVQRVLVRRHLDTLMDAGVTILDPARTMIEPSVEVGSDSEVHPNVTLIGNTSVGEECVIQTGAWIKDSQLARGVTVAPYSVLDGASVGEDASVGPFARLRPGADLGTEVRIGNFVEVKNARLGRGVKAGHLAYLGDVEVGEETNIGAGAVTCNYDGTRKHRTTIGRKAFIGSDTMLVAPVEVGDEAVTAAGSTITNDVPDDALGVSRSRQRNISDWSRRRRDKEG